MSSEASECPRPQFFGAIIMQRLKAAVHRLRVGAIIAEFNMDGNQYALTVDALRTR